MAVVKQADFSDTDDAQCTKSFVKPTRVHAVRGPETPGNLHGFRFWTDASG